jgi:hypothetical protein
MCLVRFGACTLAAMNASTSSRGPEHITFTDLLRAGTSIDFQTDHLFASTAVLAATPQERGVVLTIDGTVTHGQLWLTEAMIAAAEPFHDDGEVWQLRHGDMTLLFFAASEPAPAVGR